MAGNQSTKRNRVLLIGWDAADWNIIDPLLEKGEMPALARLIDNGVSGPIETLYPALSPTLWTSIATGKRPYKHGIHGFSEPNPQGTGIRPITNLSRKTKAVWNILQQNAQKSIVVGWWPSHPAEPIDGVMVSNHFQQASADVDKPWPLPKGVVHPPELRQHLEKLRFHPGELLPEHILPFVPKAAEIDQQKDKRLSTLAKMLAECISVNATATALIQNEPWDFMGVYFDAIDHFSHMFMRYHPPRQEWIDDHDFELYHDVVNGAYRFHDMMLGALLSLVDDDTTVMLISDHGFHSDHLRPHMIPVEPAGPAIEHSPYGIFVMSGPGIEKGAKIQGASLLDVTPTILQVFGLPTGEDMDGRVLQDAFEDSTPIEPISSWDEVAGECGMHPSDFQLDPQESQSALQQLIDLGYIEDPGEEVGEAIATTNRELQYNLARAYMDGSQYLDAISILQKCWDRWPEESRLGVQLIQCHLALEMAKEARETLTTLFDRKQEMAESAAKQLQELVKQYSEEQKKHGDLDEKQAYEMRALRAKASVNPYAAKMLEGSVLFAEKNFQESFACYEQAEKFNDQRPEVYLRMGQALRELERHEEAVSLFRKALALDPQNTFAHLGICRCQLKLAKPDEAETSARQAIHYRFQNPWGHYFLAAALIRNRRFDDAVASLQQAISQNPNFPEAHAALVKLYGGPLKDYLKQGEHQFLEEDSKRRIAEMKEGRFQDSGESEPADVLESGSYEPVSVISIKRGFQQGGQQDVVTVVSGLPRSGTSMMMNMLDAAGIEILTDENRQADEDNPLGYFEFLPATQLRTNRAWIPEAKGKAVKVVAQLLPFLPRDYEYRFILMDRSLDEVLASQEKMLARKGKSDKDAADLQALKRVFQQQFLNTRRILDNGSNSVMVVPFAQCISEPLTVANQLGNFLGRELNEADIAKRVDSKLYRSKM
ncbi:alkaline phosphatase family protein [Rhodopirellula sp.]|nr:alkaline phosphatase family protein [Rhodopirellula sp.]